MSADVSADVVLIKTGQYNVADLLDPSVSLWNLFINYNNYTSDDTVSYIIEIRLDFNNIKPAIWAATYPRTMSSLKPYDNISNFDLQDGAGVIPSDQLVENSEFSSLLEQLNYLPAGAVTLDINIYDNDDNLEINPDETEVIGTLLASDQEFLQNNVVSELTLLSPTNEADESSPYPWFRWESPGFGSGVRIDYTLYIYQYDPIIHSGPLDAIEDNNYLYFSTEISKYETGSSQQIQVQYPSNSRDLAYGYQYVWYVEGRDIIADYPFNNQSGIWGWPEPITSPIYKFNFGSAITAENVGSPPNGSEVSTVLPTFTVDPSEGVNGYEIWLSNTDDSEVENPIWQSGSLQSNVNRYPSDATGLMPGFDYKWKIRANPDSDPGPWSNIFDFNIASYTLDDPSSHQTINTIFPTFYFSGPSDIAGYELRISNNDDPTVDYGNIYSEYVQSLPYELPTDIPISLQPGNSYFWKLIFLDDSDNIVGEIDDYTTFESFRIKEIELISPSNGESDLTLTPSFMWESPIGVPQYEFSLSGSDDPLVENPLFTTELSGTYYQFPQYGSYSLEFGELYYWKVNPIDINGDKGPPSTYYSFSTQVDVAETVMQDDEFGDDEDEFGEDEDEFGEDEDEFGEEEDADGLGGDDEPQDDEDEFGDDEDEFGEEEDADEVEDGDEPKEDEDEIEEDDESQVDEGEIEDSQDESQVDEDEIEEDDESQVDEGEIGDNQDESQADEDEIEDSQDESQVDEDEPEIEQGEIYIKPEFALQGGASNAPKDIIVKLLRAVSNSEEHVIFFSENQNMSSPLEEVILTSGQTEATLDGANIGWGLTIYVQLHARTNGEYIGEESNIQVINIPELPGRNDQVGISATYESSSTQLSVEIINLVQNASEYILSIASDAEMSEIFFSSPANSNMSTVYPETADPLIFGNTYFLQVYAMYENEIHGMPSSVTSIFIPNIVSPVINEQYSWQPTLPASNSYVIQFSTTDDFTSIVFEEATNGTVFSLPKGMLNPGTVYYWRVQGLDDDNNSYGNASSINYFTTESIPAPSLHSFSETTSLLPEFTWEGVEEAQSYLIYVSSDANLEEILWSNIVTSTSTVYDETALLLDFSSTYYWTIATLSDDGSILSIAPTESFSTTSLSPVTDLSPSGATETFAPNLKWELNNNYESYRVMVSENSEFNSIILDVIVTTNTLAVEGGLLEPGSQNFWRVEGLDANGANIVGPSETALLVMPSLSEIPLISPANNDQVSNLNPTLKWGSLEDINSYKILIAADPEFSTLIIDDNVSMAEFHIPEDKTLINGTTYYWQIEAATETIVVKSAVGIFATPPEVEIKILSLDDAADISIANPIFSWEGIEGISAYNIQFSQNSDFSESWLLLSGSNNFEYPSEPALEFNQLYYWRVCALNNEGDRISKWTNPRSFSLSNIYIVNLEAPASAEVITTKKPTFSWAQIEDVNQYEIRISANEDYSQIMWQTANVTKNSVQYPSSGAEVLLAEIVYYWSVRAISDNNPLGEFSESFNFTISEANEPVLTGPINELSENIYPFFTWNKIPKAHSYGLVLGSNVELSQIIIEQNNISDKQYQYPKDGPPLEYNTAYYWKVIAYDEDSTPLGDYSATSMFTTPNGIIQIEFIYAE